MFIEFFRTDARGAMVLGLAPSQWQSVVFLIIGIALLVFYYFKKIPFFLPEMIEEEREKTSIKVQLIFILALIIQ